MKKLNILLNKLYQQYVLKPFKGEPVDYTKSTHHITMPINGISMEQWSAGAYSKVLNSTK